ncbi:uncharacterized protein LOC108051219 [Drosophila rhopaloa]|uniref:Uncharacterized protein LOC108051219 n=1 Tax=Drosophila rhopaloa TaxID=1041015 RepID=A0A6P4FEA4_DRORH|nr:uncharacterized protein LOC108051219 [Drosophila rhopaloa]
MRSSQVKFITLSLFLLGSLVPLKAQFQIDLDKLGNCADVGIKAASALALRAVPCIKSLATCAKFVPMKTKNLDITALALLAYQYLLKIINNQKCLLKALKEAYDIISPHFRRIVQMKCLPF